MVQYKTGYQKWKHAKAKGNAVIHGRLSLFARRTIMYVLTLDIPINHAYCRSLEIYTSTIESPSAVQISKSIKQTQSVGKVYYNTRV